MSGDLAQACAASGEEAAQGCQGLKPVAIDRGPVGAMDDGNCKGMITLAVLDDEHLRDFEDYMP